MFVKQISYLYITLFLTLLHYLLGQNLQLAEVSWLDSQSLSPGLPSPLYISQQHLSLSDDSSGQGQPHVRTGQPGNPGVIRVQLLEEVLMMFRLDAVVEYIITGPPGTLAPLQTTGVHGMVRHLPRVGVLGDVLQPYGNQNTEYLYQSLMVLEN